MPNQNHLEESSKLIKKIKGLDFVISAGIDSISNISCRNFNNTLTYNKNSRQYIANINLCGNNYKILVKINGNKSNPRYERKLKKIFPR